MVFAPTSSNPANAHAPSRWEGEVAMKRREFLKVMTVTAGATAVTEGLIEGVDAAEPARLAEPQRPAETVRGDMRYRQLGRTREEVSVLGLGGYHIGKQKDEEESIKIIRTAIDAGVTFMHN